VCVAIDTRDFAFSFDLSRDISSRTGAKNNFAPEIEQEKIEKCNAHSMDAPIFHLLPTFRFYLPMTFLFFQLFVWFPPRNVFFCLRTLFSSLYNCPNCLLEFF
jgi:hypothetical protein